MPLNHWAFGQKKYFKICVIAQYISVAKDALALIGAMLYYIQYEITQRRKN
jgi:hypothetical protein